jgi:hypothetical protein
MYLIIRRSKYSHGVADDYRVEGTSDYLEGAQELLAAHNVINKNKSVSFSIVNMEEPLVLTDEIKDSKQLELPL